MENPALWKPGPMEARPYGTPPPPAPPGPQRGPHHRAPRGERRVIAVQESSSYPCKPKPPALSPAVVVPCCRCHLSAGVTFCRVAPQPAARHLLSPPYCGAMVQPTGGPGRWAPSGGAGGDGGSAPGEPRDKPGRNREKPRKNREEPGRTGRTSGSTGRAPAPRPSRSLVPPHSLTCPRPAGKGAPALPAALLLQLDLGKKGFF